jgi:hypothetical protein
MLGNCVSSVDRSSPRLGPGSGSLSGFFGRHIMLGPSSTDAALLPVEEQPVPGYSKGEKEVVRGKDGAPLETASAQTSKYGRTILDHLLRGTIITIGCNNIFGQDPPKAWGEGGNAVGYPGFTYDATGRFVYARLTKKF